LSKGRRGKHGDFIEGWRGERILCTPERGGTCGR
jgi:hypothetical protein